MAKGLFAFHSVHRRKQTVAEPVVQGLLLKVQSLDTESVLEIGESPLIMDRAFVRRPKIL